MIITQIRYTILLSLTIIFFIEFFFVSFSPLDAHRTTYITNKSEEEEEEEEEEEDFFVFNDTIEGPRGISDFFPS